MGEIIVLSILIGVPAAIIVGVIQMFNGACKWWRDRRERSLDSSYRQHVRLAELEQQRQVQAQRRRQHLHDEKNRRAERQSRGTKLQVSFMQLPTAPDAQRLMSWSSQCVDLPQEFRRRQFGRFQNMLMEQIPRWLTEGVDREQLESDLRKIASNLGVAKFEADYMVAAMAPPTQQPQATPEAEVFAGELAEVHSNHQRRVQTIEAMVDLAPDVREELLEAEEQRYRGVLFGRRHT